MSAMYGIFKSVQSAHLKFVLLLVKGKIELNLRVIASHSSSYWISLGPGSDSISSI